MRPEKTNLAGRSFILSDGRLLEPVQVASTGSPRRHLMRDWWERGVRLAAIPCTSRLGLHNLRRKYVNDLKPDTPMADLCYLGGWKSPLTVLTVHQQPDEASMRTALVNRALRRAQSA